MPSIIVSYNIERMCKHICEENLQPLLNELEKRQFNYAIDKHGKLHLVRNLPTDLAHMLPKDFIPKHVLRVFQKYRQGELSKDLIGAPKYHDKVKLLRRYHLINPPTKAALSPLEKRAKDREYLRQWRRKHATVA